MKKSIIIPILITIGSFFSLFVIVNSLSYYYEIYDAYQKDNKEQNISAAVNYPLQKSNRIYDQPYYESFNIQTDKLIDSLITIDAKVSFKHLQSEQKVYIELVYDRHMIKIHYKFGKKFETPEIWAFFLVFENGKEKPLDDLVFYERYKVSRQTIDRLKSICKFCKNRE